MAANVPINSTMLAKLPAAFDPWRQTGRSQFGWAGALSLTLHAMVAVLAMGMIVRTPQATSPIRVFLVPPPPPPPAIGASHSAVLPQPRSVDRPLRAVREPA